MSCLCMVSQSQMSLTVNALVPTQCFSILIGCLQTAAAVSIDTVNILAHYADNRSGSATHVTELIPSWLHHPYMLAPQTANVTSCLPATMCSIDSMLQPHALICA